MNSDLLREIEAALGQRVSKVAPLSGGCVGEVYRVTMQDGAAAVAKVDKGVLPKLDVEGCMLKYLRERSELPTPQVYFSSPSLLVMEFLEGSSSFSASAEVHAADLLAALHELSAEQFGFERDTLIGGLHQPNAWTPTWRAFFREQRLLAMGRQALDAGCMRATTFGRLERFATRLDELVDEPAAPSLLHGDVWSANVLAKGRLITGFVDPAIYYGHAEIELAFIRLFSTFGERFFRRYHERRGIAAGFDDRVDIYNLYPLLVHTRLFGGGYLQSLERTLSYYGC